MDDKSLMKDVAPDMFCASLKAMLLSNDYKNIKIEISANKCYKSDSKLKNVIKEISEILSKKIHMRQKIIQISLIISKLEK